MRSAVLLLLGFAAVAQEPPRFEVASIKPSPDPSSSSSGGHSGNGRVTMTNVTLLRCIMGAYALGPNQIAGGPAWMKDDRWEIVAKAETRAGDKEMMKMLQTLLAERFRLQTHWETRSIQAYVMEVAKGGPKLQKTAAEASSTSNGRGDIDARATTMTRFAEVLSRQMDLPVVDKTGLDGIYDVHLKWTLEKDSTAAEPGVSVFTAIQEQLGLRLRAQKTPIEVLVVDKAERPSEN